MVALRSARLEASLGSQIETVQYAQLMTLIDNRVPEAFDLDYKSELYGALERDKQAVATDVAALANTAGGLLILGIAEDDQARAASAPGVSLADAEERRITSIVGSRVVPLPAFEFLRIEDQPGSGHGLMLIAVPRSLLAPHAVIVNEGLRYPRRNGTTTRYLSEPEVAAAYRDRFAAAHRQADRAQQAETEAIARLSTADDQLWVVVSMVPDLPGELVLDQAVLRTATTELIDGRPQIVSAGLRWMRVGIGRQRLLADGGGDNSRFARYLSADLHADGTGVCSAFVLRQEASVSQSDTSDPPVRRVTDESIVNGILSGLRFLAQHARDRTAASGNALVRAQLYPVSPQQPLALVQDRRGFIDSLGTRIMTNPAPPLDRIVPLETVATDSPDLVAAAYLLATDIMQEFGCAEAAQLTRDGQVRLSYWGANAQPQIRAWADAAGISVTEEVLP
jgi:Putative DNA-binding domain